MLFEQKLTDCLNVEFLPSKGQLNEFWEKVQASERLPGKGQLNEFREKVQASEDLPAKGQLSDLIKQTLLKPVKQSNFDSQVGLTSKQVEPQQLFIYNHYNHYHQSVGCVANQVMGNQVSLIQDGDSANGC